MVTKRFLLLLGIVTICHSASILRPQNVLLENSHKVHGLAAQYVDVDVSQATENPEIQKSLQYGITQIVNKAIQEKRLPLAEYTLSNVESIQRQVTGAGTNDQFKVTLTNGDGSTKVTASFNVFTRKSNGDNTLTSYNYKVSTSTPTTIVIEPQENNYQQVSLSQAKSDETIQACLSFGVSEVLRQALGEGKISGETFSVTNLNSVEQQTIEDYTFYRFNVDLANNSGDTTISASVVVVYNKKTKNTGIKSILYKVAMKRVTTVVLDSEGYAQVDVLDVQRDAIINAALQYGVSEIINKGLQDKRIPIAVYTVTNVISVGKQQIGSLQNYKFEVELSNNAGTTVRASFVVSFNTKTGTNSLLSYSYNVKTVSTQLATQPDETAYVEISAQAANSNAQIKSAIDFCTNDILKQALNEGRISSTNFKQTTLNRVLTQTVNGVLFLKIDVTLQNSEGSTVTTLNYNAVVASNPSTNEKQVRSFSYNVKTTKTTKTTIYH